MIKLFDLKINHLKKQKKINQSIFEIIRKSNFIMGDEVYLLEKKLTKKLNTRYVVTCANGTDALNMSLMTFGFKKKFLRICDKFFLYSYSRSYKTK